MTGSLLKYFSDRGGADSTHRGQLHWPGTAAGLPLRGPTAPLLRGEEFEDQITHTSDFHSRVFRLWLDEDKAAFDKIMDHICSGWYVQRNRYDRWSDEHTGLIVWLEWLQLYGEAVNGRTVAPPFG